MTTMIGGVDISGDPDKGHGMFMSIVIGHEEEVLSIFQMLGREKIHMHEIKNKIQDEIISKLNFKNDRCMAMCFRIDRQRITSMFKNQKKPKTTMPERKNSYNV